MEIYIKNIETEKGVVQGCQLEWTNSWLFLVDAPKGSIVCGSFDIESLNSFGLPAARVTPEPDNPAFNIYEFLKKNITKVNKLGKDLGVEVGMSVVEASEMMY